MFHARATRLLISLLTLLLLAGCTAVVPPATDTTMNDGSTGEPRVHFASPADGSTVSSPVRVTMIAEDFVVEPAGDTVTAGHGHLHIMVDTACVESGQGVPKDDTHLHYGQGQLEAELELAAGEHTLCLQAADGVHVALAGAGMTDTITVVVE
jgi:hypothetical protein